ncbi:hypothetical protein [Tissierella creatinophila]|uniref:Uncharacterized protein n=1 Tax=Tissierella creatinophila DSM 6911 TaxID=1123403 RepID=A0A1U7M3Y6_TISCR|nr:hypothetical protein [Tissierella creatinophila]OLS01929.1 hypothetical protein TICRE_20710 [Tissierella creatinophila DSM 6911]
MGANNISKITFLLGIVLLVIAYLIPHDSMEFLLGQAVRPLGLISVFINPVLGIIGSIFSLVKKQWLYLVLNIILIFSFSIIMSIGYSIGYILQG